MFAELVLAPRHHSAKSTTPQKLGDAEAQLGAGLTAAGARLRMCSWRSPTATRSWPRSCPLQAAHAVPRSGVDGMFDEVAEDPPTARRSST